MKKLLILVVMLFSFSLVLAGCGDKNEEGGMGGEVVNVSETSLELLDADGEVYQFSLDEVDKSSIGNGDGVQIGDSVIVYYKGETDDDNIVQKVKVTSITVQKQAEAPLNPGEGPAPEGNANSTETTNYVEGTIVDVAVETITIKAKDGNTYSFNKENATINMGDDNLAIGEDVTIGYEGEISPGKEFSALTITED